MQARAVVAYGCLFSGLRYICNTCTQVADRYITLILRKEFNRKSPFGIPGRELLLEHVHPTIEGHRVIANCFLEVLRQNQSCFSNKKLQIGTSEDLYNFPVLEFDSLAGEYACLQLRKGFPFYEKDLSTITPKTEVEKIAANYVRQKNWYQSMDQLYQLSLIHI